MFPSFYFGIFINFYYEHDDFFDISDSYMSSNDYKYNCFDAEWDNTTESSWSYPPENANITLIKCPDEYLDNFR